MTMTGIDFESECVYFACETCKTTGIVGHMTDHLGAMDPDYCGDCSGCGEIAVYIGTWLTNLAMAAALCESFNLGLYNYDVADVHPSVNWRPGCRWGAP